MKKIVGTMLATAIALSGSPGRGMDRAELSDRRILLSAEGELARTTKAYLWLDLAAMKAEVRIQGNRLKEWNIAKVATWGRRIRTGAFKLKIKSALKTPERMKIVPGEEKKPNKDEKPDDNLGVLELRDMPRRFTFDLENGIRLKFRPASNSILSRMGTLGASLIRSVVLPLETVWAHVRGRDITILQIVLEQEDAARALYWTAQEGMSVLIYSPKSQ